MKLETIFEFFSLNLFPTSSDPTNLNFSNYTIKVPVNHISLEWIIFSLKVKIFDF